MKYLPSAIFSLLILFVAGQWAVAANISEFDIAGVKLGMSLSEVETIASSRAFVERGRARGPDFEQAVRQQNREFIDAAEFGGVNQLILESESERLTIRFVPFPESARVADVSYEFFGPGSSEVMAESVFEKFGEPDHANGALHVWGDALNPFDRRGPSLEYSKEPTSLSLRKPVGSLILHDPTMWERSSGAIKEAALTRVGKKPGF